MSTITNRKIILEMLRSNGRYNGDPIPDSIWLYESNMNNEKLFAVFYPNTYCDIFSSPYVRNPILLMRYGVITLDGKLMLAGKL